MTEETLTDDNLLLHIFKGFLRKTLRKDVPELLNSFNLQELDPLLVGRGRTHKHEFLNYHDFMTPGVTKMGSEMCSVKTIH